MSALLCSFVVSLLLATKQPGFTSQTALSTLRDDHAQAEWARAAQYLVEPASYIPAEKWMQPYRMKGESLRETNGAEVTSLMVERALALESESAEINISSGTYPYGVSFQIGHYLAHWNPRASLSLNKILCASALKKLDDAMFGVEANWIGVLISDRAKLGDHSAADDLIKFSQHFNIWISATPLFFTALWNEPNDASVQKAGEAVFQSMTPNSKDFDSCITKAFDLGMSEASHLILVPAFRRYLAQLMLCNIPDEFVRKRKRGEEFQPKWGSISAADLRTPHGYVSPSDVVANHIHSLLPRSPDFDLFWPEARRAPARSKIRSWLLNDALDWKSIAKDPWGFGAMRVRGKTAFRQLRLRSTLLCALKGARYVLLLISPTSGLRNYLVPHTQASARRLRRPRSSLGYNI